MASNEIRPWFSHDFFASQDEKLIRVDMKHGVAGTGVFWRILERLGPAKNHRMEADYELIAYSIRVSDVELVRSVVEDFGLFVVENGVICSTSFNDRLSARDEKLEEKRNQQRLAGQRSAAKRAAKKLAEQKESCSEPLFDASPIDKNESDQTPEPVAFVDVGDDYLTPETFSEVGEAIEKRMEETREDWNEIFKETANVVRSPVVPTTPLGIRIRESTNVFSREEMRKAFVQAKKDNFAWTFNSASKKDNVQQLLVKAEKAEEVKKNAVPIGGEARKLRASPSSTGKRDKDWNALYATSDPYE